MPRPPAETHGRLRLRLHQMIGAAMRADENAARTALAEIGGRADAHTTDLLLHARRLVLATTAALDAVLETHRHVSAPSGPDLCRTCRTAAVCPTVRRIADTLAAYLPGPAALDRTEAWRQADAALGASDHGLLVGLAEIEQAFVAWTVPARYPACERPTLADQCVLLVDKVSGRLSRWPALPLDGLAEHYRRYRTAEL